MSRVTRKQCTAHFRINRERETTSGNRTVHTPILTFSDKSKDNPLTNTTYARLASIISQRLLSNTYHSYIRYSSTLPFDRSISQTSQLLRAQSFNRFPITATSWTTEKETKTKRTLGRHDGGRKKERGLEEVLITKRRSRA